MPTYSNRRPDAALLQCWIERDTAQWLDANVNKKGKGRFVNVLLAQEIARREERQRLLAKMRPVKALVDEVE